MRSPYDFTQEPKVLKAYSRGITRALPMIGSEGGLGGKGNPFWEGVKRVVDEAR